MFPNSSTSKCGWCHQTCFWKRRQNFNSNVATGGLQSEEIYEGICQQTCLCRLLKKIARTVNLAVDFRSHCSKFRCSWWAGINAPGTWFALLSVRLKFQTNLTSVCCVIARGPVFYLRAQCSNKYSTKTPCLILFAKSTVFSCHLVLLSFLIFFALQSLGKCYYGLEVKAALFAEKPRDARDSYARVVGDSWPSCLISTVSVLFVREGMLQFSL